MKVADLIAQLQAMPQDANVCLVYDGAARGDVECVWVSNLRDVLLSERGEPVYYGNDRPVGAPSEAEDPHWKTT